MSPDAAPTGRAFIDAPAVTPPVPPPIQTRPWPSVDRSSARPGYKLTPERVWSALRQAEMGYPATQIQMVEDVIESDGHLRGLYISRMTSVAYRPVILQPGDARPASVTAAEILGQAMVKANYHDLAWQSMDAVFQGFAPTEMQWGIDDETGAIVPKWFSAVPLNRFRFDTNDYPLITSATNPVGDPLLPGGWVYARRPHRRVVRAGLMRTAIWWALFKRMSMRDWMVFAEKFGIPLVLGFYEERASEQSRKALEEAIIDIGTDGAAILSEATRIVVESGAAVRGGDVSSLHPAVIAMCNAEMSKLINGSTLSVETGGPGSFALGKVHENRSNNLSATDAFWLEMVLRSSISQPFLVYNGFAAASPPRWKIQVVPDMAPLERVTVAEKLQGMGLELDAEQMYEEYGLRRPGPATLLKKPEPKTEKPNVPAGE